MVQILAFFKLSDKLNLSNGDEFHVQKLAFHHFTAIYYLILVFLDSFDVYRLRAFYFVDLKTSKFGRGKWRRSNVLLRSSIMKKK